jgi:hypothetical protein
MVKDIKKIKEIYGVIRDMVLEGPKTAKDVAEEVGKTYPTLMRELNVMDSNAKLGVELLLPLMKACQSVMPLRFLASRMGYRVVSLAEISPDSSSLTEKLLSTYPALAEYHRAIMENQPLEYVAELREHVIRQAQEDFVAYARKKTELGA